MPPYYCWYIYVSLGTNGLTHANMHYLSNSNMHILIEIFTQDTSIIRMLFWKRWQKHLCGLQLIFLSDLTWGLAWRIWLHPCKFPIISTAKVKSHSDKSCWMVKSFRYLVKMHWCFPFLIWLTQVINIMITCAVRYMYAFCSKKVLWLGSI